MPVPAEYGPNSSVGNGVTTIFAYDFMILEAAHLLAQIDGVTVGGYTVAGVGDPVGGSITFGVAPANGSIVLRARAVPYDRNVDYQENGDLLAETLDDDQDRQTMQIQQLVEHLTRVPAIALGSPLAGDIVLPPPGASEVIRWNSAGTALETVAFETIIPSDIALVTPWAETLLDDTSAAGARDTLQIGFFPIDVVSEYGADNTGATNTATDLQAAIDASVLEGRGVYFPPGTYETTGVPLVIPTGCTIIGGNPWTTKLRWTSNTNLSMVLISNVDDVNITGLGLQYTAAAGTLGYAQAGFNVRNGSSKIKLRHCVVQGKVNRGIQILNSEFVTVEGCATLSCSNSGIRAVSDFAADAAPLQVINLSIIGCDVYGAATIGGTLPVGTYGINLGAESGASDLMRDVHVIDCHVEYTSDQGYSCGGKVQVLNYQGCTARGIATVSGVGFLVQRYSITSPSRVTYSGCQASSCDVGFYSDDATIVSYNGCIASNNVSNGFISGAAGGFGLIVSYNGCHSISNGGSGWALSDALRNVFSGNHAIGNSDYGISSTVATDRTLVVGNIIIGNTLGQLNLNGTNEVAANNIIT